MRIHTIACAAISIAAAAGCSSELAERAPANDPGSVAAVEAPFRPPPSYQQDPLLGPPPDRHGSGERPGPTVYGCPMHPGVRQSAPGKCPKCGMPLGPVAPPGGGR